jgi:plasmid stabilization system protein ParE
MRYRLRVLPEAENDIDRIYIWIAGRSPEGAVSWYRRVSEIVESLREQPLSFGLAPEHDIVGREIRDVNFKTRRGRLYRILFEVREDEVLVLHVRGPGQRLLRRDEIRER